MSEARESCLVDHISRETLIDSEALKLQVYHCSMKSDIKTTERNCWLLLAIVDHDATHFGYLHDN